MGDDGAGPAEVLRGRSRATGLSSMAAARAGKRHCGGRELRPQRLLIVDATDMGQSGEIRIIDRMISSKCLYLGRTYAAQLHGPISSKREDVGEGDFCWYPTGYRRVLLSDDSTDWGRGKYRLSAHGRPGGETADLPRWKRRRRKIHIFREGICGTAKAVRRT